MTATHLWTLAALAAAVGYLLGSIPFGVILTRLGGAGDIRQIGSGNIGATNVLRTGRKELAAATLILDMLKATAAVLIALRVAPGFEILAGAAAFIGHCYPVWLRFKGGKGVATMMGVCLGLSGAIALAYALIWIGMLVVVRISSAAGLTAAISAPVAALLLGRTDLAPVLAALAAIVAWKHHENIRRLLNGTEPRIGGKRG